VRGGPTPRVVALVGPESTGKTTLAARLAAAFDAEWSAESARVYEEARRAAGTGHALGPGDVEPIARGQIALEDAAAARARAAGRPLVVRDTDLVSTVVYARHYYGTCPAWIVRAAAERRADFYLALLPDDVAWAADSVRDATASRATLAAAFASTLVELGCAHVAVGGAWEERERAAVRAVRALIGRLGPSADAPPPAVP
jgi:NadR type nicotinamide-nucleotide adenylyltransferase